MAEHKNQSVFVFHTINPLKDHQKELLKYPAGEFLKTSAIRVGGVKDRQPPGVPNYRKCFSQTVT